MQIDVECPDDLEADDEENNFAKHASWRSLFNFTSKWDTPPLLLALIFSIAAGIIAPALAVFLGKIFDLFTNFGAGEISGSDLLKKVSANAIVLVALGTASGLLHAGYFTVWLVFGELQAKHVREMLFDSMLEKDMGWYDMRTDGIDTLVSRLQTHVRDLQLATSQPLGFAVQDGVTTLAALGLAFYYSWSLTLVTLSTVPVLAVALAWNSARMQPSIEAQTKELTKASKIVNNALSAIDTVKCFNGQDFERWQYREAVKRAARYYLYQVQANALQIGGLRLITLGMFVQGFWFGSHLVQTGQKNPGDILTAFWACLMATQAFEQIQPEVIVLEKGRAAGATLKSILGQMEVGLEIARMSGRTVPLFCAGDIEVRNVSFSYPSRPDQPALSSASFYFPAGETTFIVGRSGSGKSTLGNLLMHFYNVECGEILIDGHPINNLDINWLRNNVTLVQQQSVLFNESVFKNIAFGHRDHGRVRKEEVKRAIETALLQHTISDLPQGLDTVVGTGGSAVSGGQRQRVSIARARLRDTPILILDEATSALDHISKSLLVEGIREWRQGKTTIVITHDMSQVQDEDYAYVLDSGVVIQEGFKNTLEKSDLGPFQQREKSIINFPATQARYRELSQGLRSSSCPARVAPLTRKKSEISMVTQIQPKKGLVSAMLKPQPENVRRPLQAFVPASPPTSTRQLSVARSKFQHHQREISQQSDISGPISPLWVHDVKAVEMTRRESDVLDIKAYAKQQESALYSSVASPRDPTRKRKPPKAEKPRPIAPMKKILMTVWPALTWEKRMVLVLGFLCAGVHAAATPTFSWVFSKLLATFYLADHRERSHMARQWSLMVLAIAVVDSSAAFSMHFLLEYCGQAWIDTLRIEAFKRVLDQPRSWFEKDRNSVSRLTECLDRSAEEMRNLLGRFAGYVFVAVTMVTMAIIWSLVLSWRLTLVGLASAPFMYVVTRTFETVSGHWENRSNDAATAANTVATETFSNIRTVRALTLEGHFRKKYAEAISTALKVGLKRSAYSGFFFGLSESGILFVTALIFYYGAILVSTGAHTTETILTVFTMLLFSMSQANNIIAFVPQMNSSRDTATRLLRLAFLPHRSSHEGTGHIRLSHPGPITFTDTTFAYPARPDHPVLSSLNLTLHPGTSTALVGASGCGKSTIASLLLALHPPDSGTLTINHVPISHLHTPTLRTLIALVPQQPALFAATVAANIAYGLPESSPLASPPSIRAAATAARVHDFILSLPQGYGTPVGAGGAGLSGGQTQRIALARALVGRPGLLVLDEATSGLDGETAAEVRETVRRLAGCGVGVLVVTHQRAMMEGCGEVVVLKDGRVAERGGFRELVGGGGVDAVDGGS
ncbi:hypothetical protein HO173_009744 [Letharia columbiana]|uniref:Uncharacterized protein n=1 Tax=Letharia columbiana TaxID=112416 RepID=A0A8H6FNR0_9LECA|nr:uncharacterized protein HO173_009744 [Letharia columbiana]KAF6231907.1 hypothetical protein HO173_009744 [Letharia columbiana]